MPNKKSAKILELDQSTIGSCYTFKMKKICENLWKNFYWDKIKIEINKITISLPIPLGISSLLLRGLIMFQYRQLRLNIRMFHLARKIYHGMLLGRFRWNECTLGRAYSFPFPIFCQSMSWFHKIWLKECRFYQSFSRIFPDNVTLFSVTSGVDGVQKLEVTLSYKIKITVYAIMVKIFVHTMLYYKCQHCHS